MTAQAVAELLFEVLRVLVSRDKVEVSDALLRDRAANGAQALVAMFDVRARDERPRWVSVAMSEGPDPRISHHNSEYGKRQVSVALLIDSEGWLFEMVGRDEPIRIGRPPVFEKEAA